MNRMTRTVLRWLAWIANPALAGAGFVVLSLGVVTWLPALAAMAHSLRGWRRDGEERCFTGVFVAFPRYLRTLLPHSVLSTGAAGLLAVDVGFLAGRPEFGAFAMLGGLVGLTIGFVLYHLGIAVAAACNPEHSASEWRRHALVLAFGSPRRTISWLAALIAAPVLSLAVPFGPLLLGPSLPVLVGLTEEGR
jgi:uncharacterized membrane protein YesL